MTQGPTMTPSAIRAAVEAKLEQIATLGYGIEMGDPPDVLADYWATQTERCRSLARAALSLLRAEVAACPGDVQVDARAEDELPVQWVGADGTSHDISIDYAAQIAKWMFDTYGDAWQVDAVLQGEGEETEQPAKENLNG